jgi:hypothetical protein
MFLTKTSGYEMAALNRNLKIEFTGDLSGLSLVVNGKTFYVDNNSGKSKERTEGQIKLQKNHSINSTFASCVNKIPIVKKVWSKSLFSKSQKQSYLTNKEERHYAGKAAAFNKIMAANRKVKQDTDHPTAANLFVPGNLDGIPRYDAILTADELIVNLDFIQNNERMKFSSREEMVTGAAVFSAYNPKKRSKVKFEVFPMWERKKFIPADTCQFTFQLSSDEQDLLKRYNDCYLYFTIVTETEGGRIIRGFDSKGVTSSLKEYLVSPVHFTNEPTLNNNTLAL